MNVTAEINKKITQYGGSGSSRQDYLSSNKSLNLNASANNINRATGPNISAIPVRYNINDEVGLFGAENNFTKITVNIQNASTYYKNNPFPENDYFDLWITNATATVNDFETGIIDNARDQTTVNTFNPAIIQSSLSSYARPVISVSVKNLKSGNQYLDNWLDYQVYDSKKNPYDYDDFYIFIESSFYLGFHARNTKRLPVNFQVDIGTEFLEFQQMTPEQKKRLLT